MSTARAEAAPLLSVEVVYSPAPDQTDRVALRLAPGATVASALRASGLLARHALDEATLTAGVWGHVQALDQTLREHDRIEIYRPLIVDPKEARRLRYKRQGSKTGKAG